MKNLPSHIHAALRSMMNTQPNSTGDSISEMLRNQVEEYDREFGKAFEDCARDSAGCDDDQLDAIFNGPNREIINLACCGTTLSAALIDGEKKRMWVLGLGDSSIGEWTSICKEWPF
jgi:serine/threonine protein phosphatase PrpC